jgi:polyisoprenoid-binding protein YceI
MRRLKTLLTGAAACGIAATATAAPEVYTIENAHTYPSFEVPHQGLSWWRGKFNKTSGKIWLDREKQTGKMDITIDTSTVNFGMDAMDQRAKNQDWFHVEKYPTATYKSDSITFKNGVPVEVNGEFTLRGITKPLKLEIREFRCADNPMLKREMCGADAHAAFDRRDFGMTQSIFNNDGRVRLQIAVEAVKGDAPLAMPPGAPPGGPPPGAPPAGAPPL